MARLPRIGAGAHRDGVAVVLVGLLLLVGELCRLPGVARASDPLDPASPTVAPDLTTAHSTVTYTAAAGQVTPEQQDALRGALDGARATGLTVEVTGEAVVEPPHAGGPAEALGVALALVVLALTYGSLVTAGMNLLTAAVGVGIGILGITITTGFSELSSTTPTLAAMLGLAVGIDDALFIATRYRQELVAGRSVPDAVATAVGTAGSAVLSPGSRSSSRCPACSESASRSSPRWASRPR